VRADPEWYPDRAGGQYSAEEIASIPMRCAGKPQDVANVAVFPSVGSRRRVSLVLRRLRRREVIGKRLSAARVWRDAGVQRSHPQLICVRKHRESGREIVRTEGNAVDFCVRR
jgi:hypothetical protein